MIVHMELPVAPQSYQPPADSLVRAVQRAHVILARTVTEEESLDGANVYACADRRDDRSVNFAAELNTPATGDATVVQSVLDRFAGANCDCHRMMCGAQQWPQDLADQLGVNGYDPSPRSVHMLSEYTPPQQLNTELQIIPARAAYGEMQRFYQKRPELNESREQSVIDFLDESRLELFLGRLNRQPVAAVGVLTLGNIGVIYDPYTDPDYRGRGIGTTMMAHTLDHCRRAQFEQVIIELDPRNPSLPFFESIGFKQAATFDVYVRKDLE